MIECRLVRAACLAAVTSFAILSGAAVAADLEGPRGGSWKDDPVAPYSPLQRYYVSLRGAFAFPEDTSFEFGGLGVDNSYEDLGYAVSGAVGMRVFETPSVIVRGELELGYRDAEIESHTVAGVGTLSGGDAFGNTSVLFGLANLIVDFKTGTPFVPYLSVGGGFGNVEFDGHGVSDPGIGTVLDDSATGYAFQAGAGVSYDFGSGLSLDLGYRYLGVYDVDLEATDGTSNSVDVEDHQILIGLTQRF